MSIVIRLCEFLTGETAFPALQSYEGGVLKQTLADLPENMKKWAFEVLLDQARLMRDLAKIYVRVDTGSLRDSIRVERGGEGMYWRRVRVRAGGYVTNPDSGRLVDYAVYVEARYPFLRPAFEQIRGEIATMIKNKVVAKAGGY